MQVMIKRATLNQMAVELANAPEVGLYSGKELLSFHKKDITIDNLVNLSIEERDGTVLLEINDKMLVNYIQLYIKLAKVLMPIWLMFKNSLELLKTEAKKLESEFFKPMFGEEQVPIPDYWVVVNAVKCPTQWLERGFIYSDEADELGENGIAVGANHKTKEAAILAAYKTSFIKSEILRVINIDQ